MTTLVLAVTAEVVTEKVALDAPAATVTLAGTAATDEFALLRLTNAPPLGAALVKVTVPFAVALPPTTELGLTLTAERLAGGGVVDAGVTVSVVVRLTPPSVAVMTTLVLAVTAEVVTEKVAVDAPAATVTLAGTAATDEFALLRVTNAQPLGAPLFKVTVPVDAFPPTTALGLTLTAERLAAAGGVETAPAVNRREPENGPATPAELKARTRQKSRCEGSPVIVACDTFTVWLNVSGALKFCELSICISYLVALATSDQSNVIGCPTFASAAGDRSVGAAGVGGGVGAEGLTVRSAVLVTPPPETEIVTTVCVLTELVEMLKPPVVEPAGIITPLGTDATAGSLLATCNIWSVDDGDATVTVAKELPPRPVVEVGLSVSDAGGCCGVSVTCACAAVPA